MPITVLQQISVGLSDAFAFWIAASTASTSWPSTCGITFQPYASKRFGVSSWNQFTTSPSIEMPLSSYSAISLFSFSVPASEQASCEMPSIMQPSPRNTYVW